MFVKNQNLDPKSNFQKPGYWWSAIIRLGIVIFGDFWWSWFDWNHHCRWSWFEWFFYFKMFLSISITLNSSSYYFELYMQKGKCRRENAEGKTWRGEWQVACTPTPILRLPPHCDCLHTVTASSWPVPHTVYCQFNFTHFTAVLNYLVFHNYNIYLIL